MSHPVLEFQILSSKPDETAEFYSQLFGWTVNSANAMNYRRIQTGSTEGIQGGIWPAPPEAASFVQLFIGVENVAASVQTATGLGARVLIPPTPLPEGGELAVLRDPTGVSFGVYRGRS
jgi:predicted enzyme related to lactoylglutathione lyase